METDTIQGAVNTAFWVALLLGCDTTTAEAAVLDGIGACDDVSHQSLLIEAIGFTFGRRESSAAGPDTIQLLPTELLHLFRLPPRPRDCFVLRILLGIPPEAGAGVLNISVTEFDDALYAALDRLPLLSSPNT